MIKRINLKEIRQMEFLQVMHNIKRFVEKEDTADLGIVEAKKDFDEVFVIFDDAVAQGLKSEYTEPLQEIDKTRVKYLMGLYNHAKNMKNHPVKERVEAGKKVLFFLNHFGKRSYALPLLEKTAVIDQVVQSIEEDTELKRAYQAIDALVWIEALKEENKKFSDLYNNRTIDKSTIEIGKGRDTRKEMQKVFGRLCKVINALALINGIEKYKRLINNINEEIKQSLMR